jgi:hypothetical protein
MVLYVIAEYTNLSGGCGDCAPVWNDLGNIDADCPPFGHDIFRAPIGVNGAGLRGGRGQWADVCVGLDLDLGETPPLYEDGWRVRGSDVVVYVGHRRLICDVGVDVLYARDVLVRRCLPVSERQRDQHRQKRRSHSTRAEGPAFLRCQVT